MPKSIGKLCFLIFFACFFAALGLAQTQENQEQQEQIAQVDEQHERFDFKCDANIPVNHVRGPFHVLLHVVILCPQFQGMRAANLVGNIIDGQGKVVEEIDRLSGPELLYLSPHAKTGTTVIARAERLFSEWEEKKRVREGGGAWSPTYRVSRVIQEEPPAEQKISESKSGTLRLMQYRFGTNESLQEKVVPQINQRPLQMHEVRFGQMLVPEAVSASVIPVGMNLMTPVVLLVVITLIAFFVGHEYATIKTFAHAKLMTPFDLHDLHKDQQGMWVKKGNTQILETGFEWATSTGSVKCGNLSPYAKKTQQ